MAVVKHITYFCDNTQFCSSEADSQHGLPDGWFAMTYALPGGPKEHQQFCSVRCIREGAQYRQEKEGGDAE